MANVFAADATTVVLNGHALTAFVAGDKIELAPVNAFTSRVYGTNQSVNVYKRSDANVHTLTLRIERMSDDDIFLNSAVNQDQPTVFNGSMKTQFVKNGTASVESWVLENGTITTRPTETINDQDGNALMEYVIEFANAQRNL